MEVVSTWTDIRPWRRHQHQLKCGLELVNLQNLKRRRLCALGIARCVNCTVSSRNISTADTGSKCSCWCGCGRRQMFASVLGATLPTDKTLFHAAATKGPASREGPDDGYLQRIHPKRPDWYEELYARILNYGMVAYEAEMANYKAELFKDLRQASADTTVLELGVGTAPNLKYYARKSGMNIIGVDPNKKMEKYARAAATDVGLSDSQFKFIHAVGEKIPLPSSSVDAIISTLVLCSVTDLNSALGEVTRVLKPGATFYFVEHVAAERGSNTRFWQDVLDPVQQFVADGCHLTRDTLSYLQSSFASVAAQQTHISSAFLMSPHVIGTAKSSQV